MVESRDRPGGNVTEFTIGTAKSVVERHFPGLYKFKMKEVDQRWGGAECVV